MGCGEGVLGGVWKLGAKAPLKSVTSCIDSYIISTCILQTGDSLPTVNGWECRRFHKLPNIFCKIWETGCMAFTRSSRGSETSRITGILAREGFSEWLPEPTQWTIFPISFHKASGLCCCQDALASCLRRRLLSELVLPPTARSRAEAPAWRPERKAHMHTWIRGGARCLPSLVPLCQKKNGFGNSWLVFRDANSFGVSYSDGKIFLHERGRDKSWGLAPERSVAQKPKRKEGKRKRKWAPEFSR